MYLAGNLLCYTQWELLQFDKSTLTTICSTVLVPDLKYTAGCCHVPRCT